VKCEKERVEWMVRWKVSGEVEVKTNKRVGGYA